MNEKIEKFLNNEEYILAYRINYDSAREVNQELIDYIKLLQQENQQLKEKLNCIEIYKQSLPENTEFVILTKDNYERQQKELEIENVQLKLQLKQRDEVIEEAIKFMKLIEMDKTDKYIPLREYKEYGEMLEILNKYKGDNNEYK